LFGKLKSSSTSLDDWDVATWIPTSGRQVDKKTEGETTLQMDYKDDLSDFRPRRLDW